MLQLLTLLLLLHGSTAASRPCCEGENRIVGKRCVEGGPLTALSCPSKYITGRDNYRVDQDDNLIIATSVIPKDRYCSTNINNTDVYIVCFSNTATLQDTMFKVNAVLELVSVFFLVLTIMVYLQVSDLLDLQGVCILHSISALALSFLVLAFNQLSTKALETKLCLTFAYVMYFCMIYSFFWLNVLSFHIWRVIVKPHLLKNQRYWPYIYHAFGILGPVALLALLLVASSMEYSDMHPGFGETKCWFKSTKVQFVYFYAPMGVLLCLNIIYYSWTISALWRDLKKCDEKKAKVLKYRLVLCIKLFFIMGISWIFELLSAALKDINHVLEIIWHITDCLNTLQGILIFLILVVFRKRVVRGLANRSFCGYRLPGKWRTAADDECEEIEQEFGLSETQLPKN